MFARTFLLLLFGGILIWDFVTVGVMEAAITRAADRAIETTNSASGWLYQKVEDYRVGERLRKAAEESEAAMVEMMALEEIENKTAPNSPETASVATLPPPQLPAVTDFGDSVFSRKAIDSFIAEASVLTDIPDHYLAHLAERESAFDPVAAAGTSSAKGLYQFTESTWLDLFARHGPDHGQEALAKHIKIAANGRPSVESARIKRRILNLRFDPKLSTFMAAHYAREQRAFLTRRLDRQPNYAELYIAHFLGAGGAAKLFIANEERPRASAVDLFPAAAKANRRFFYDSKGKGVDIATLHANLLMLCDDLVAHA